MAPIAVSPPRSPSTQPVTDESQLQSYRGYHHVHWWVGNAKQAAAYYVTRMGFERVAYKGLETKSRAVASHVIRNGGVTFVLSSPYRSIEAIERGQEFSEEEKALVREMHAHMEKHGDAVKGMSGLSIPIASMGLSNQPSFTNTMQTSPLKLTPSMAYTTPP